MEGFQLSDIFWKSSDFVLELNNKKLELGKYELSNKIPRPSKSLVDINQYKHITELKERIPNTINWNKWKRLVNPYDKVQYLSCERNSREYYKYHEILKQIDLPNETISMHIGETYIYSIKALKSLCNTEAYSIDHVIKNSESEHDLSVMDSIEYNNNILKKADIVIIDPTVCTDHDPINQEQLVFNKLLEYVLKGLQIQNKGGIMISKVYDTFTRPTCQLIYYLCNFYKTVQIIKPRVSRYTSSEKFIVLKNFIPNSFESLEKLSNVLNCDTYVRLLGIDIPSDLEERFMNYNKNLLNVQISYIERVMKCNYSNDTPEKQLEAFQNKNAIIYCKNFDIPVNIYEECLHSNLKQIDFLKNTKVCENCFRLITC